MNKKILLIILLSLSITFIKTNTSFQENFYEETTQLTSTTSSSYGISEVLTITSIGTILSTGITSEDAKIFLAHLGTSSLAFLAASISTLYFASPNAHHPEHDGIKITINGKTYVHKKDATEWIFDVEQLEPVRKKIMAVAAITGALGVLAAAYFDNKTLNAVTLSAFLGTLASCGIVVGLEMAMNHTDKE